MQTTRPFSHCQYGSTAQSMGSHFHVNSPPANHPAAPITNMRAVYINLPTSGERCAHAWDQLRMEREVKKAGRCRDITGCGFEGPWYGEGVSWMHSCSVRPSFSNARLDAAWAPTRPTGWYAQKSIQTSQLRRPFRATWPNILRCTPPSVKLSTTNKQARWCHTHIYPPFWRNLGISSPIPMLLSENPLMEDCPHGGQGLLSWPQGLALWGKHSKRHRCRLYRDAFTAGQSGISLPPMFLDDEQRTLRGSQSSASLASSNDRDTLLESQIITYGTTKTPLVDSGTSCTTEASREDVGEASEVDPHARRRLMYAVPALVIGIFLSSADQTIVVASYGRIGSEMKALHKASWIATAYIQATSCVEPRPSDH